MIYPKTDNSWLIITMLA